MKNKINVMLAAALASAAIPVGVHAEAMTEAETEGMSEQYEIVYDKAAEEKTVTGNNVNLYVQSGEDIVSADITADYSENGDATLSLSFTGTLDGEDVSFYAHDVLRFIKEEKEVYLNAAELASAYEISTGANVSDLLPYFGITSDWVYVPGLNLSQAEQESDTGISEELVNAVVTAFEPFISCYQTDEDGIHITVEEDTLKEVAEGLDQVLGSHAEEITGLVNKSGTNGVDLIEAFEGYLHAAAEGYQIAYPEATMEEADEVILQLAQDALAEAQNASGRVYLTPEMVENFSVKEWMDQLLASGDFLAKLDIGDSSAELYVQMFGEPVKVTLSWDAFSFSLSGEFAGMNLELKGILNGLSAELQLYVDGEQVLSGSIAIQENGIVGIVKSGEDLLFQAVLEAAENGGVLRITDAEEKVIFEASAEETEEGFTIKVEDDTEDSLYIDYIREENGGILSVHTEEQELISFELVKDENSFGLYMYSDGEIISLNGYKEDNYATLSLSAGDQYLSGTVSKYESEYGTDLSLSVYVADEYSTNSISLSGGEYYGIFSDIEAPEYDCSLYDVVRAYSAMYFQVEAEADSMEVETDKEWTEMETEYFWTEEETE